MTKKILKRNTFKEAFTDVLKLSYDDLKNHSVDPFIKDAFDTFVHMDFGHTDKIDTFRYGLYSYILPLYKDVIFNYNGVKEYSCTDIFVANHFVITDSFIKNFSYIIVNDLGANHDSLVTSDEESSEVQQWLLAA
jgi:hypothetical protein